MYITQLNNSTRQCNFNLTMQLRSLIHACGTNPGHQALNVLSINILPGHQALNLVELKLQGIKPPTW
ncbi:hypothetical protein MTR_7g444850 [Medicago truncatula]|uniref:Uncharacterized protein n=1 Tax=Medicago truncatula TaxID=3880 RepID=A0A072TZR9_MEDTR|nr:hypothetical protein MTR_7g444850 [Medicago truncatula]